MDPWQVFIIVFSVVVPFVLLGARDRWHDDRLTFRGRPNERDWRPQVEHGPADDGH